MYEGNYITRRQMLAALPALAMVPRMIAQTSGPPIRVRKLNHFTLRVSDVKRSADFYQGLFGMPIQARQGSTVCLRIGSGPQFFALSPTAPNEAPSIHHLCFTTENFNADRITRTLTERGIKKIDPPSTTGAGNASPMSMWVRMRGPESGGAASGTPELYFSDPDGLIVQLQDPSYCGGGGALGNACTAVEPSSKKGLIAVKDLSHFTIFGSDSQRANKFYQDLFGLAVQASQGPNAPLLGVGDKIQFVMFGGGGGGRGGANAAPARPASINHVCLNMDNFNPDNVLKTLTDYGIKPRGTATGAAGPLVHYVSMRMENRGGAKEGTPELYFTDPDGLLIQLQDTTYCGGAGVLGNVCS